MSIESITLHSSFPQSNFRSNVKSPSNQLVESNDEKKSDGGPLGDEPLREAFQDFVGQTLFGSMLSSMRKTVGKPAYMHGGRGEEIFQEQMDQYIVEDLTKASASSLADPMFDLFNMQRQP